MKVSASFLSSKKPEKDLSLLNITDVDYIHVDMMDGKFVKEKSFSMGQLKKIYKYTSKRLDVHLMVNNPKKYIKKFVNLNTEFIVFHVEVNKEIEYLLKLIKSYGVKCGLSVSPTTEIEVLEPYLELVDMILVMSVEPGRGEQAFIPETVNRISKLKEILNEKDLSPVISVDGGINDETKKYVEHADIVVSGSYIINSSDFQEKINTLR